jgi:hypothetical protein
VLYVIYFFIGKECSKKWQLLRVGYRKRRHSLDAPTGSGAKKIKKWAYFEVSSFLEPHMVERAAVTNITGSSSSRSYSTDSEGFLEKTFSDEEIQIDHGVDSSN